MLGHVEKKSPCPGAGEHNRLKYLNMQTRSLETLFKLFSYRMIRVSFLTDEDVW